MKNNLIPKYSLIEAQKLHQYMTFFASKSRIIQINRTILQIRIIIEIARFLCAGNPLKQFNRIQ